MVVQYTGEHDLYDLIEERTGLKLDVNRRADIARLVEHLIESEALSSTAELVHRLRSQKVGDALWQDVIHAIVVGETYFFRNEAHFNALRHHVLPALIKERRAAGRRHLRIWSAGCASGEEPYSLAILLHELLDDLDAWSITILATDINLEAIKRARLGRYGKSAFRNETPPEIRVKWFQPKDDRYELLPEIRRMVLFSPLNLAEDDYPSVTNGTMHIDLIVCRNVTIYFNYETLREVIARFERTLNDKGWLVVGHSEPLAINYQGFAPRNFENAVFYQKLVPPSAEAPPPPKIEPPPPPPKPLPTPKITFDIAWRRAKESADREQWGGAAHWLAKAEQIDPLKPQLHYLRALVQMQTGNMDGALDSLRRAVAVDARFALAHYWLGELYETRGDHTAALHHWRQAQRAIVGLPPQKSVRFAEDLTVEMLLALLRHRLEAEK